MVLKQNTLRTLLGTALSQILQISATPKAAVLIVLKITPLQHIF